MSHDINEDSAILFFKILEGKELAFKFASLDFSGEEFFHLAIGRLETHQSPNPSK